MPAAVNASISVRCMSCRHRNTLDAAALKRFGLKPEAPIARFIKRLRCTKCGSGSVMAERVPGAAHSQRRAS
jgi:ribosomal protein S27AE